MDKFELKGSDGKIIIQIKEIFGFPNSTCFAGGCDCLVEIEIKVKSYFVKSCFYASTGEIFTFYKKLKTCQDKLNGIAEFNNYEKNFELKAEYKSGQIKLTGKYQEDFSVNNALFFDFTSDQSYFKCTIGELEKIFDKYGGVKGIKN